MNIIRIDNVVYVVRNRDVWEGRVLKIDHYPTTTVVTIGLTEDGTVVTFLKEGVFTTRDEAHQALMRGSIYPSEE